jgi:hypothetical protein
MRIPSYDDLTPSIPDISPGEVFGGVARLVPMAAPIAVPAANAQRPAPSAQRPAPSAHFDQLFACLRSARLPEAIDAIARDFSPRIQRYGADAVVLDVSGLGHLLGPPQAIGEELARASQEKDPRASAFREDPRASAFREDPRASAFREDPRPSAFREDPHSSAFRIAIAPSQTAALLLTLSDAALTVVAADESTALAPLPLQCLQQHVAAVQGTAVFRRNREKEIEDQFAVLRRWGLNTLGDLAALPAPDLSARMGQAGLARGRDPGPLVPDPGVTRFIERIELEWPIDALEPLSFVLARLLDPLSSALERAGRAAAAIRLHLRLVDRTTHERVLQLPAAMRDPRVLRTLLLLDLESHAPPAAVDIVTIEADPAPGRVIQYSLLERALPSTETLATLMARLGALIGESRCGSPRVSDTYRPDAFELDRFNPHLRARATDARFGGQAQSPAPNAERPAPAIRRFRPSVAVRVTVDRGRPVHLAIDRRGMPGGTIVQAAGPWRSSGAWWDTERLRPTRGAGLPAVALTARGSAFAKAPADSLRLTPSAKAGRKPGEAGPPSVKLAGVPASARPEIGGDELRRGLAGARMVNGAREGGGPREHEEMWDRDEWDVELADGSLCRLFHDRAGGVWFLDGIVD